jgi:hypothetical protein
MFKKYLIATLFIYCMAMFAGCSNSVSPSSSATVIDTVIDTAKIDTITDSVDTDRDSAADSATIRFDMGTYVPDTFYSNGVAYINPSYHSVSVYCDTVPDSVNSVYPSVTGAAWQIIHTHTDTSIVVGMRWILRIVWYNETSPYAPVAIHTDSLFVTKDTTFYFNTQIRRSD